MSIKIDTSDFLPDLDNRLRKAVEEALGAYERRQAYKRTAGSKSSVIAPGYMNKRAAAAYIGVTTPTFDKHVRGKIRAVRFQGGTELYSVAAIDEYLKSLEG